MTDIKSLEHPTLKVPYEILNKKFRSAQKVLDREVSHVTASLSDVEKMLGGPVDRVSITQQLDNIKEQLVQLKSKGGESLIDETRIAEVTKKRADHLRGGCVEGETVTQEKQWRKVRLDRMLVEYFLRQGFYTTAIDLATSSGIEDLTNIEVFLTAKEVEESLSKGDISKCLAWCHDNKSKLRKMKSTLEFQVRLQEFLELVKTGNKLEAVKHAKKFLSTDDSSHLGLVQQGMGLLAFPLSTVIQPYKDLLDASRWQGLIQQFRQENYRLHQLSSQSMFTVALQSGLASLKTPHCYKQSFLAGMPGLGIMQELRPRPSLPDRNPECPVCHPELNKLAASLPFAHCSQSRLVCSMTGRPLNEHNHPLMLPNGYVYGEQALHGQASQNDGQVICPRTKDVYSFKEAEKIYIM